MNFIDYKSISIMEPVGGAIGEVAKTSTAVAAEASKPIASGSSEQQEDQSPLDKLKKEVDQLGEKRLREESEERKILAAAEKKDSKIDQAGTSGEKTPADSKDAIALGQVINADEGLKEIFEKKLATLQASGKTLDGSERFNLQMEALKEWAANKQPEAIVQEAEKESDSKLTPEERAHIKDLFKQSFQEHPLDMIRATKQATELAKAKLEEIELKSNQNATQEEREKVMKKVAELQNKHNLAMENIKDNKLKNLIQEALGNTEVMKILQETSDKRKLSLVLEILGIPLAALVSLIEDAEKTVVNTVGQQQ